MDKKQVETMFDAGELDAQYASFIMDNPDRDRSIYNANELTLAMEQCYLADAFIVSMVS